MDVKEHSLHVGYIHTNLTALESSLRFFLLKANDQKFSPPKPADVDAPLNYITKYISLDELIKKYHGRLTKSESAKYTVCNDPVLIRDALAHGRLVAPTNDLPWTLWKFGRQKKGRVPIERNEVLTADWLEHAWKMIKEQQERVNACSRERGYPIN
jgi:hypothetical protein